MSEINVTVDTSRAERQLDNLEQESLRVAEQIVTGIRRAVQFGTLAVQAIGIVIDESFRLTAEAVVLIAEVSLKTALYGLNPALLAGRGFQIALLYMQVQAIESGRQETATRIGALEQGLDLLLY